MLKYTLPILFFFILNPFSLVQGQKTFHTYSINDGLSQNSVFDVFKDKKGFYWIATQDGLNCYDGKHFNVYRHNRLNKNSLTDNFILCIKEDSFNQLWIGTRHGINRIDAERKIITPIQQKYFEGQSAGHNDIKQIQFDSNGNLYFSLSQCLFRIKKSELKNPLPRVDTLYKGFFNCFLIDKKNILHFIAANNYFKINLSGSKITFNQPIFTDTTVNFAHELYLDLCQNQIIMGNNSGLYRINEPNKCFEVIQYNKQTITGIRSVKSVCKNEYWIATDNGLFTFNLAKNKIDKIESNANYSYALPTLNLNSVSVTYDSIVWIGTVGYGVSASDLLPRNFSFINGYSMPKISSKIFTSICFNNNNLLIGTDNGVFVLDQNNRLIHHLYAGEKITSFLSDESIVWVGTSHGIKRIDHLQGEYRPSQSISPKLMQLKNEIFSLKKDHNDILWIGTYNGLYNYSSSLDHMNKYFPKADSNTISSTYILSIDVDKNNTVWFGHGNGFSSFHNGKFKNFNYVDLGESKLTHRIVSSISCINEEIWLGTYGGGITIYNKIKKSFSHLTTSEGLSSDMIVALQFDNKRHIYAGTSNGLNVVDIKTKAIQKYFKENGLISNQFSFNGSTLNHNDRYFASTNQGIVTLHHSQTSRQLPLPVLKDLLINHQITNTTQVVDINNTTNHLLFNLAIPDVRWGNQLQLQYRLLPNQPTFKTISSGQTSLELSNLQFGNYTLNIRTYNPFNKSVSAPLTIKINNIPPFTQTNLFKFISLVLGVIIVGLVLFIILKFRYKRSLRKIEEENRIILERERISRDLHDNIGSQLTYIASTVDYLKQLNQLNDTTTNTQELLNELGQYTRKTVQNLRDTIWAISHDNITLDEFSHRIKTFMVNYLSYHKYIEFSLALNGDGQAIINPTALLNLFRIIQESTNNIIKHAEASKILIEIQYRSPRIHIQINDNGKGFDVTQISNGYGLAGMRQRTEDMNGKFSVNSKTGVGTTIQIEFLC